MRSKLIPLVFPVNFALGFVLSFQFLFQFVFKLFLAPGVVADTVAGDVAGIDDDALSVAWLELHMAEVERRGLEGVVERTAPSAAKAAR